jgi:hypothetical protein
MKPVTFFRKCPAPQPVLNNSGRAKFLSKERRSVGRNVRRGARRTHNPDGSTLECSGSCRCGNPMRVAPSEFRPNRREEDGAKRRLIETLRRRRVRWFATGFAEARERRPGEILVQVAAEALEGKNPGEPPAGGALNTRPAARDSRKGRSPETAAC